MRYIIILIIGIIVNIMVFVFLQITKMDLSLLGAKIWILFVLPLILAVILILYTLYSYFKYRNKYNIIIKIEIIFFLFLIPLQFLLFFNNGVIVR
jgi:hypothetical protein